MNSNCAVKLNSIPSLDKIPGTINTKYGQSLSQVLKEELPDCSTGGKLPVTLKLITITDSEERRRKNSPIHIYCKLLGMNLQQNETTNSKQDSRPIAATASANTVLLNRSQYSLYY